MGQGGPAGHWAGSTWAVSLGDWGDVVGPHVQERRRGLGSLQHRSKMHAGSQLAGVATGLGRAPGLARRRRPQQKRVDPSVGGMIRILTEVIW